MTVDTTPTRKLRAARQPARGLRGREREGERVRVRLRKGEERSAHRSRKSPTQAAPAGRSASYRSRARWPTCAGGTPYRLELRRVARLRVLLTISLCLPPARPRRPSGPIRSHRRRTAGGPARAPNGCTQPESRDAHHELAGGERMRGTVQMLVERRGDLRFELKSRCRARWLCLRCTTIFRLRRPPEEDFRQGPATPSDVASLIRIPLPPQRWPPSCWATCFFPRESRRSTSGGLGRRCAAPAGAGRRELW